VIRAEGAGFVVEDSNSRNGLAVNGARVRAAAPVAVGDAIAIGPFQILLRLETSDVRLRFDWTDPQTNAARHAVHRLPVTFGRDADNTIVIADPGAAGRHVVIQDEGGQVVATDLTRTGGVAVNGLWAPRGVITAGAALAIGAHRVVVTIDSAARRRSAGEATIVFSDQVLSDVNVRLEQATAWPPPVFAEQLVHPDALTPYGLPVATADYATVGAGIGGFIWADNLVVRGVRPDQIVALGVDPCPYSRYKRLCKNSQIPDHERLRSDSGATPDNLWGWPGYALREIWQAFKRGRLGTAAKTFWQVFGEPSLAQTYTPRAGDVFQAMDREGARIGWNQIMRYGRVRAIRKTTDGRYVLAYSGQSTGGGSSHAFLLTRFLHLATGYPALQFLPDLQRYREDTEDFVSVVNAYEEHDHVYEHLQKQGGVVILRGRGIVASRILQRLAEVRRVNPRVGIVHAMRTPITQGHKYGSARRIVANHFELQPFNWPKACWGGDLRVLLERSPPDVRKRLLTDWGGTTTAPRHDWRAIVESGLREGWYQIAFGEVERVERTAEGRLVAVLRGRGQVGGQMRYEADFIIDATGLEAKAMTNPIIGDLITHYALALNGAQRLAVEPDFGVAGLVNGAGRAYAAGALTAGGFFAPVDSFLGLQYAAQVSLDALARLGAPGLGRFGMFRSFVQWLKWARGAPP
jgi:pSer/pThr/pTyr-binding forkhead associated (FHA) protein